MRRWRRRRPSRRPGTATRSYSPERPHRTPPPRLPPTSSEVWERAPAPSAANPCSEATEPRNGIAATLERGRGRRGGRTRGRRRRGRARREILVPEDVPAEDRPRRPRVESAVRPGREDSPPVPVEIEADEGEAVGRRAVENLRGRGPEPRYGGEDRVDPRRRVGEAEGPLGVGLQDPDDGRRRSRESADDEGDPGEGNAVRAKDAREGSRGSQALRGARPAPARREVPQRIRRARPGEGSWRSASTHRTPTLERAFPLNHGPPLRPGVNPNRRKPSRGRSVRTGPDPDPGSIRTVCRAIDGFSLRRRRE